MKKPLHFSPAIAYKHYKRYKRKYTRLLQSRESSVDKLDFLRKRILRLKEYLQNALLKTKLAGAVGAMSLMLYANTGEAQTFATPVESPYGLAPIGNRSKPVFVDLDNDGDFDMMSGHDNGLFYYFKNTGSASAPAFAGYLSNPYGLKSVAFSYAYSYGYGYKSTPAFADLDNDGDMDMLTGDTFGNFYYFKNTGSASAPAFAAPVRNPYGMAGLGYYYYSAPTFVDLDFDGDMDLMVGDTFGDFHYFKNTGTASAPAFAADDFDPFGIANIGDSDATPSFADLDFDGDMDMMSGEFSGNFHYFKNTGTAFLPAFAADSYDPFGLTQPYSYSYGFGSGTSASLIDLDNDGDLDLMSGEQDYGAYYYYENTCASPAIGSMGPIAGTNTICINSSGTYSVAPVSGAAGYQWVLPIGWTGSSVTNTISVTSFTNSGSMLAIAKGGCKGREVKKMVTINASPIPTITAIANPTVICKGQTSSITGGGGSTYSWNTGATTESISVTPTVTTMYTVTGTSAGGCSNTASVNLVVQNCTGIQENSLQSLSVYPNPSKGLLYVELNYFDEKTTIQIMNALGEVVLHSNITKEKSVFDFQQFSNGIYFVRVSQEDKQQIIKVIKE